MTQLGQYTSVRDGPGTASMRDGPGTAPLPLCMGSVVERQFLFYYRKPLIFAVYLLPKQTPLMNAELFNVRIQREGLEVWVNRSA